MLEVERAPNARSRRRWDMQQPKFQEAVEDEKLRTGGSRNHGPSEGMVNFEMRSSTGGVIRQSLKRTWRRRGAPPLGIEKRLHDAKAFTTRPSASK